MLKKTWKAVCTTVITVLAIAAMIAILPNVVTAMTAEAARPQVSVFCENTDDVFYGDVVTLRADMDEELATANWIWEAGIGDDWTMVQEGGMSYEFVADAQNTNLEYRVVFLNA